MLQHWKVLGFGELYGIGAPKLSPLSFSFSLEI